MTSEKSVKIKEFFRAVKFLLFSISAGIIQFGVFALLNEVFGLSFWVAHIPAVVLSVLWNFTFNRKYTFKSSNNVKISMLLVLAFYVVFTPASVYFGDWLERVGWDGLLVEALMMVINFVLEFSYCTFVVYRGSIDSAEKKREETDAKETVIVEACEGEKDI